MTEIEFQEADRMDAFHKTLWEKLYVIKTGVIKTIDPIVRREGLTIMQGFVLNAIAKCPCATVSGLAKAIDVNQGNTSTICKKLEQMGYLTRTRSKQDERIVTLALTEQGEQVRLRMEKQLDTLVPLIYQLPPETFTHILKGLEAMETVLDHISVPQPIPSEKEEITCSN